MQTLLVVAWFVAASAIYDVCPDDTASWTGYALGLGTYATESALFGAGIGAQSEGCSLPVTPQASTFSVWGNVYTHLGVLVDVTPEERHHLLETFDASSRWFRSFAGDDPDNVDAVAAIGEMRCHMRRATEIACEEQPRTMACCAHTQHYTWLRVAYTLSDLILGAYGSKCGSRLQTDAQVEARFATLFGALLRDVQAEGEGVEGVRARTAMATLAWAYRGACEEAGGTCPAVNATAAELAPLEALSKQGGLVSSATLVCVPETVLGMDVGGRR